MQEKITETAKSTHFKRVWIGDPCYVIPDQLWDKVCAKTYTDGRETGFKIAFSFEDFIEAGVNIKTVSKLQKMVDSEDLVFLQCGTAYGDGRYQSISGFPYGVDSGSLGIVPDYLVSEEAIESGDDERLGKYFELEHPGSISLITDGNGEFRFLDEKSSIIEMIYTGDFEDGEI